MTQLRELQQQQCSLAQDLHAVSLHAKLSRRPAVMTHTACFTQTMQARWKLSVTVEELRGRVQSQKAAAAQAVAQSQQQRVEVSQHHPRATILDLPQPQSIHTCPQAEKSAAELQRLREQRQDVVEALQREEALQRDLEAEAAALTATRVSFSVLLGCCDR
jgi:hypothetical protein